MDSDLLKAPSSSEFYFPSLMSAGTSCSYGGLFGAEEGWFQIMINWCDFPSKFLSIWSGGGGGGGSSVLGYLQLSQDDGPVQ